MKTKVIIGAVALLAGPLLAADSSPKDEVKNAAKKLADKANYSWKSTVQVPEGGGGGRFRPGPTEGKTEKDGLTYLSMTRGDNTVEAVLQGGKGALKLQEGWQSLAEATADDGGQPGPGRFIGRMVQNYKVPAVEAADLVGITKELKAEDGLISGDLTEEGAKSLLTFGGRGGGNGPEISQAKGSVRVWIQNGVLSKYEYKVQGKVSFNGNDRDIDRTTTVEIKDVGTTKVEVPEAAKKKLS
jgi:hypothetical protein